MDIIHNPVIVIPVIVWLAAELTKFLISKEFGGNDKFFQPGGMPSGHASVISAAVTVIGLTQGVMSPLFGFSLIVAAIIFHDAVRVRWAAGQTAERLNELLAETGSKVKPAVVWRGHRIREVAAGAIFGTVLAWISYQILY